MTVKFPRAIVDVDEFVEGVHLMVYADGGAGKTTLAATAPDVLYIATGDGTIAARKVQSNGLRKVWPIPDEEEADKAFKWVLENPPETTGLKWICVDTATDLQELYLQGALARAVERNRARDPYVPDRAEYLKSQNKLRRTIQDMHDTGYNVLWTAHVMRTTDPDDEILMMPLLPGTKGDFTAKCCAMMHIVGYLGVLEKDDEEMRRLRTSRRGRIYAKDQLGAFDGKVDNPTIPAMMELIEASFDRKPTAAKSKKNGKKK